MTLFSCECHNPFDDKSTLIQVKACCRITLLVNAISDSWVHESSAFGYDPVRLECANQLMLINPRWRLRSGIRILSGGTNPVPEPMLTCYQPDPGFIVKVISMPNFRPFLPCRYPTRQSEGFDSCDRPSKLTQIGFKSSIFQPMWPRNLMDDPEK